MNNWLVNNYVVIIIYFISGLLDILFMFYSNWMLDDGMINATIVRTFKDTNLLTHHPSDILSTSTSPLFTLFAGILSKIGFHEIISLKLIGIVSLKSVAFVFYLQAKETFNSYYGYLVLIGILFFAPNIAYAQCGLETFLYSFLVIFCLRMLFIKEYKWSIYSLAILIMIRPDGILLAPIVLFLIIKDKSLDSEIIYTFLIASFIFLFYLICHYLYFDSFIPHSIIAKRAQHGSFFENKFFWNIYKYINRMFIERFYLAPIYPLAILGAMKSYKLNNRFIIYISWWLVYHIVFSIFIPLFSWYLIPPMPVLLFFSMIGLMAVLKKITEKYFRLRFAAYFMVIITSAIFTSEYFNHKKEMGNYNTHVLKALGQWLNLASNIHDTITTESLGYIGYYSKRKIYDMPGLANREIPVLLENSRDDGLFEIVITSKNPNYLALREAEWDQLNVSIKKQYKKIKDFQSPNSHGPSYIVAVVN
jgi:hypothetical protein